MTNSKNLTLRLDDLLLDSNDFTGLGYTIENLTALVDDLIDQHNCSVADTKTLKARSVTALKIVDDLLCRMKDDIDNLLVKGDEWRTGRQK